MRQKMVTRTERRVEKKQALTFLVLVFAVSLVSFALGVMVGRMSSPPQIVQAPEAAPERISVAVPASVSPQPETSPAVAPTEHLTFFDTLPKGEQPPMGSGINLPRQPKAQNEESRPSASPPPRETRAPVPSQEKTTARPSPPAAEVRRVTPAASAEGTFVLQVASFQDPADARKLQDHLASRGHSSYTEQANLGEKGVWTRVFIGPYDSEQEASTTASRLLAEEKISPLVRRK